MDVRAGLYVCLFTWAVDLACSVSVGCSLLGPFQFLLVIFAPSILERGGGEAHVMIFNKLFMEERSCGECCFNFFFFFNVC